MTSRGDSAETWNAFQWFCYLMARGGDTADLDSRWAQLHEKAREPYELLSRSDVRPGSAQPTVEQPPHVAEADRRLDLVLQDLDVNLDRVQAKIRKLEHEARKLEEWRQLLTTGPGTRRKSSSASQTPTLEGLSQQQQERDSGDEPAANPLGGAGGLRKGETMVQNEPGSALKPQRAHPLLGADAAEATARTVTPDAQADKKAQPTSRKTPGIAHSGQLQSDAQRSAPSSAIVLDAAGAGTGASGSNEQQEEESFSMEDRRSSIVQDRVRVDDSGAPPKKKKGGSEGERWVAPSPLEGTPSTQAPARKRGRPRKEPSAVKVLARWVT
jgi:hypothetical protein